MSKMQKSPPGTDPAWGEGVKPSRAVQKINNICGEESLFKEKPKKI